MVQCCAVVGCKANSRKNNEVRFYCFPSDKNPDIRKQWISRLNRHRADGSTWEPKYFHKVCSRHFKEGRPTPQNPYPDQNLSPDGQDKADVVPVTPRRRARFAAPATPTSESPEVKTSPESKKRISPKTEPDSSSRRSLSSNDPHKAEASPSKKVKVSEDTSSSQTGAGSDHGTEMETNEEGDLSPTAQEIARRSSNRKRKRRVFNTPSDEEVIDNLVDEPETYVIWRRRQPVPEETEPEPEPRTSGYRMRSRRSVEEQSTPPVEVEPEVYPPAKKKRLTVKDEDGEEEEKDAFCWLCHKEGSVVACELCPRGFHLKCLDINQACPSWVCPECEKIMRAECVDTRSPSMALLTLDQMCVILRFALSQMRITGSEPFFHPVDKVSLPLYDDFITNPIDFSTLEKNIRRKMYGSTEGFLADVRWLLHNSIVFNGSNHKLTTIARAIVRICKQEISDIEGCPDCYMNAWIKQDKNWFVEPCRIPHTLVWAKLKGYPFWPGKALNEEGGQTDVRFFGAHDRAWVPTTNVFMLSREAPVDLKSRRLGIDKAMDELTIHIKKLEEKFGSFKYSAPNVQYDPHISYGHIVKGSVLKKEKDPIKTEPKAETSQEMKATERPSQSELESKGTNEEIKESVLEDMLNKPAQGTVSSTTLKDDPDRAMEVTSKKDSNSLVCGSAETAEESKDLEALDTSDTKAENLDPSSQISPQEKSGEKGLVEERPPKDDIRMDKSPIADDSRLLDSRDKATDPSPANVDSPDSRMTGLSIIERLELKMLEAEREEAELRAKELSAESQECDKPGNEGLSRTSTKEDEKNEGLTDDSTKIPDASSSLTEKQKDNTIDTEETESVTEPLPPKTDSEFRSPAKVPDAESEVDMAQVSIIGTPKKNPMLDNLVNSCKAKLGIESEEDLKVETSPSLETEDCEDRTSSSSPRTVSSIPTRQEEEDPDEEEEEEDDEDSSCELESEDDDEEEDEEGEEDETGEEEEDEEEDEEGQGEGVEKGEEKDDDKNIQGLFGTLCETEDGDQSKDETALDVEPAGSASPVEQPSAKQDGSEEPNDSQPVKDDVVSSLLLKESEPVQAEENEEGMQTSETGNSSANPSNDCEADQMPTLEILHTQSISPDEFADASKTVDEGISVESDAKLNKPELESGSDKQDVPKSEEPLVVNEEMEVESIAPNMVVSPEKTDKCNETETDMSEDRGKTCPHSQPVSSEKKDSEESVPDQAPSSNEGEKIQSESSTSALPAMVSMQSLIKAKQFPSRLLEELVKSSSPAKQVGELNQNKSHVDSGPTTNLPQVEAVESGEASQSFQQPNREKGPKDSPTDTGMTDPEGQSKMEEGGGEEKSPPLRELGGDPATESEAVSPEAELAPLEDIADPEDIPIELVTAGTSDKYISCFAQEPDEREKDTSYGINMDKYVSKTMGAVQSIFQEMLNDFMSSEFGQNTVKSLQEDMERMKWLHEQALLEMQHNAELTMAEMRLMLEHEHTLKMKKLIQLHEEEREKTVEEVKKKQWCACCAKEANFYCCWNTSYCDYPCQQKHWSKHMPYCMQTQTTQTQVVVPTGTPLQDSQLVPSHTMATNSPTLLAGQKTVISGTPTDKNVWETTANDPKIMRRHRTDVSRPPGVHYIQQASTNTVSASKVKPSAITVGKTLKLGTPGGMAVQYVPTQIGGSTADQGAPRTVVAGQGSGNTGAVPVMYQFLPRFPQTSPQNIRIISPQTASAGGPVPPVFPTRLPSPLKGLVNLYEQKPPDK